VSAVAAAIRRFIVGFSATDVAALGNAANRIWLAAGVAQVFHVPADGPIGRKSRTPKARP